MLTSLKLSNISYNTDTFLVSKLNDLKKAKKISFWAYIKHAAESNELKDHKHLFIIPDTRIETSDLDDYFLEPDPNNEKPLACKLWTKVISTYDWFLYCIHDSVYLKLKYGEDKKIHYLKKDFITSDEEVLEDFLYRSYHEYDFWKGIKFKYLLDSGLTPQDIISNGYVDLKEMCGFHHMVQMLG